MEQRAFDLTEALHHVNRAAKGGEEFDIEITIRQFANIFNCPLLLFSSPKSLAKRDEIIASYADSIDWSTILDLSDNLDISEAEASKYVNYAKSIHEVKMLDRILKEKSLGESVDVLGLDMYRRACEFFFHDCYTLLELLEAIFKIRNNGDDYNAMKLANIMSITNHLLNEGIVTKLLNVIEYFTGLLATTSSSASATDYDAPYMNEKEFFAIKFISKVAACVYIVCFQTQVNESECGYVLGCIRGLSRHLKLSPSQSQGQGEESVISALILLQLTQVRIMSHQIVLLDRNMNRFPYGSNEIGNSLPQYDSTEGLDQRWDTEIVQAFTCLVYGVFRLPMVELQTGGISSSNMIWFIGQASTLRAFSYMKLCMIPFIRTAFTDETLQEMLMSSLVCDLLAPLSYVLSSYKISCLHTPRTVRNADVLNSMNVDCLDDLLECFSGVGMAYPKFASHFWLNDSRPAPFIARVIEEKITDDDHYLDAYIPIMHFLSRGASGGGRNIEATSCVFQYFYKNLSGRHPWISTFKIIENLMHSYENVNEAALHDTVLPHNAYLIATMDFITYAMQELQKGDGILSLDPVIKLFNIIVLPVEPDLKGATLRALAAIVRKNPNCVEDVWHLMEESNLLFPAMQLGGNGSGIMDDLGGNGGIAMDIKTVLEQIEASRGRYYVTEGFLVLLDALLEYGIPEKLGIGTRRPGILVYLEYIVNEIILKAPERSYEYAGERWKVTARAFQVLRTVLLKYPINTVQALQTNAIFSVDDHEDEDKLVVPDAICATIEFDFHEDSEALQRYEIINRGGKSQQDWPAPKSAGFAVMTWLLHGGRLLESIFQVLDENKACISLDIDESSGETRRDVSAQMLQILKADILTEAQVEGSIDEMNSDITYWRRASVSTAVGILYECSRKEQAFLSMVSNATCQLTMITSIDMRPSRQAVCPRPLAELLLSHDSMDTPPILMISQYIKPGSRVGVGSKSLSVMCSALLKHVASLHNVDAFTCALSSDSIGLERLRRGCISILQQSSSNTSMTSDSNQPQMVFPMGSDSLYDTPVLKNDYAISTAVLKLILGTLYPEHLGMSHFILGLDADVLVAAMSRDQEEGVVTTHPLKLSALLPDLINGNPSNCLEAIIDQITPSGQNSDSYSIICTAPSQAKLCLEIIFRLVSATTTGKVTLALLRKMDARTNIFERLLRICMSQIDTLSNKKAGLMVNSEQVFAIDVELSNVQHCISYVLKVCSIELHTLSQAAALYADNNRAMINLLNPSNQEEKELPPILMILSTINFSANANCNRLISSLSSDLKECMKSSVTTSSVTCGIPAVSLSNEPPCPFNGFFQVDKDRLDYFLKTTQPVEQHATNMHLASQYNCLQQQASAAFHVSQAIKQFISIAALECPAFFWCNNKNIDTDTENTEISSNISGLVDCLIAPIIDVLSVYPEMDIEIALEITTTLLPLVNMINQASQESILLPPVLIERLLRSLLAALLCRENRGGLVRLSERSRGNLYTCILHLLRYPSSGNYSKTSSQPNSIFQTYRLCGMKTLEPVATVLVNLLGIEIYSPKSAGGEQCSLSATSLLSVVLSTLGPCTSNQLIAGKAANEDFRVIYGSHVFLQCIQVLVTRGHIAQIVNNMNWKVGVSDSDDVALQWILCMFTNVAMGEIGVALLLEVGIAEKILSMDRLYMVEDTVAWADSKQQSPIASMATGTTDRLMMTLVNLLRAMVMSSPASQEAIRLCTDFLHSNYNIISRALIVGSGNRGDTSIKSLRDLELMESIVSLCSVIAAPDGGGFIWSTDDLSSAWDSGLGQFAEPLCVDVCNLLAVLGQDICEGQKNDGNVAVSWHSHVAGLNDVEIEQMKTLAARPSLVKAMGLGNGKWSVFDNRLLECTLRILKYAAMTLRYRSIELFEDRDGDMSSYMSSNSVLSFPDVANVFINTSNLLLQEIEVAENSNTDEESGDSIDCGNEKLSTTHKPEDSMVERALLFISENLICVMHSQISSYGVAEISSNVHHIEKVLECAENFTSQSLIFRTGRFIKHKTIDSNRQ